MSLSHRSCCRCSKFSATAQLSKQPPAGWLHFQELLQQGTKLATAPSHQQDLNSALGRMQENLVSIQQTTCIPLAESSKVSLVSGLNTADSLQMLRCSVCHSLLLSAAFNKHLPSCRPCSVPNKTSKSKLTQPSNGRAASAGHKASSQGKGKKKAQSKGSKKPPAGPSRFAMEQTKAGMQQAVTRSLQGDASVEVRGNVSHAQPGMMPSSTEPLLAPRGQSEVHPASELEGAVKECSQSQTEAPGTRLAWTYEPCMSRSNPDLDAVNDPDLPPRFPHSVCRVARRRSRYACTDSAVLKACLLSFQTTPYLQSIDA